MAAKSSQPVSVVTGGAGFLGSHLVDRLLAEGHRVIAIDNLITGNTANIGHLAGNESFRFIKHNVSNFIFLPEGKIDYVFHLASPASPIDYLELPIPTLKVGALGTHNTLGLAKDKKASFILASTSEVYGDPLEHPHRDLQRVRSVVVVAVGIVAELVHEHSTAVSVPHADLLAREVRGEPLDASLADGVVLAPLDRGDESLHLCLALELGDQEVEPLVGLDRQTVRTVLAAEGQRP